MVKDTPIPATSTVTSPRKSCFLAPCVKTSSFTVMSQELLNLSCQSCLLGDTPVLLTEVDPDAELKCKRSQVLLQRVSGGQSWSMGLAHQMTVKFTKPFTEQDLTWRSQPLNHRRFFCMLQVGCNCSGVVTATC